MSRGQTPENHKVWTHLGDFYCNDWRETAYQHGETNYKLQKNSKKTENTPKKKRQIKSSFFRPHVKVHDTLLIAHDHYKGHMTLV